MAKPINSRSVWTGDAPSKESEEVIILPVGDYDEGTYSLPQGMRWSDFEYIKMAGRYTSDRGNTGAESVQESLTEVPKIVLTQFATTWLAVVEYAGSTSAEPSFYSLVNAVSDTGFTIDHTSAGPNYTIAWMIGVKKRYTTKNSSKEIILTPENTNGGTFDTGRVGVAQEYVLDVATVLGASYLDTKLVLDVELLINGKWATAPLRDIQYNGNLYHYGIEVYQDGNSIKVITAGYGAILSDGAWLSSNLITTPWVITGSAPALAQCRIKVWTVEQYVSNQTLALIEDLDARLKALEP